METIKFEEGTLIRATRRKQDLIPCFLEAIKDTEEYDEMISWGNPIVPEAQEDEDSDWWYSDQADWLLEDLFDILDSYAPDGCYFGTHPGDGSDFGFWKLESD